MKNPQTIIIKKLGKDESRLAQEAVILFLDEGEKPISIEKMINLLNQENFYFVVAMKGEEILGRLYGYVFELPKDNGKEMYLYEIDVDKKYQRQGVARELIKFTLELSKCQGVDCIFVGTEAENIPAQRLYASTGAIFEGNLPHYIYNLS
ncbi:GNAT family N-acetyltransferase [Dulcicalothrix desertica]|nr:GNAT family N-acetyltransferase [Dulcicalothrix desertica]